MKGFNNIKPCCGVKPNSYINFFKIFLNRLNVHISQQPYKLINNVISIGKLNAWRPNHGAVHHMRTISISLKVYNLFKEKSRDLFKEYLPNNNYITAAVLSSVFVSLARIDEDNNNGTKGLKLNFDPLLFHKIFPTLAQEKEIIDYVYEYTIRNKPLTISVTQLSSCFMLMSLLHSLLLPMDDLFIEILGFSNIFYNVDLFTTITQQYNNKIVKKLKIFHGLTMLPHYVDHCRGHFSEGIYKHFILASLYMVKIDEDNIKLIIYETIKNILKTGEYDVWDNKNINTIKLDDVKVCTTNISSEVKPIINNFKECCKLFSGERYTNILFYNLSTNFNLLYDNLNINMEYKSLLY